jgi:hypothetical protein
VGSVQYLAPALSLRARCPAQKVADFLCPRTWVDAFALRARFCVFETGTHLLTLFFFSPFMRCVCVSCVSCVSCVCRVISSFADATRVLLQFDCAVKKLDALKGRGLNDKQVWNEAQIDLVKMVRFHSFFSLSLFTFHFLFLRGGY